MEGEAISVESALYGSAAGVFAAPHGGRPV
jgi:hypothetical protein